MGLFEVFCAETKDCGWKFFLRSMRMRNCFYVDKTPYIRRLVESGRFIQQNPPGALDPEGAGRNGGYSFV